MSAAAPAGAIQYEIRGLFPLQRRLFLDRARTIWVGAGTKGGKTRCAAAWLVTRALKGRGLYWWVAPHYKSCEHGYEELKRAVAPLIRAAYVRPVDGALRLYFANGAQIHCRSAEDPDKLKGPKVAAAVVDEATNCRAKLFTIMQTVLTPPTIGGEQAPSRWLFNVDRGRRHWVIRKFLEAKAAAIESGTIAADKYSGRSADGSIAYYHFPTSANPYISAKTIADARTGPNALTEAEFDAYYLAIIQEDGAGVFRERYIAQAARLDALPVEHTADMDEVIGCDLARVQDWTVAIAMNRRTGRVTDWLRVNLEDWTVQIERVAEFYKKRKASAIVIEQNGPGDVVVDVVRKKGINVVPYMTTAASKPPLIQDLIFAFEAWKDIPEGAAPTTANAILQIPVEEDTEKGRGFPQLKMELEDYGFSYGPTGHIKYAAPEGKDEAGQLHHDDCVIALALAWHGVIKGPGRFMMARGTEERSRAEELRRSY